MGLLDTMRQNANPLSMMTNMAFPMAMLQSEDPSIRKAAYEAMLGIKIPKEMEYLIYQDMRKQPRGLLGE